MRDNRCIWSGSCSLCPYLENCPCEDEEFKYYCYKTDLKESCYVEITKSNNFNTIMSKLGSFLRKKTIAKKYINKDNMIEITITLDGPYSWDNSIRLFKLIE